MATVFTIAGKQWTVDRMDPATTGASGDMKYVGWGTGAGTSAVGDTTLFTEDSAGSPAYARALATITQQTITNTGDTYQADGTITSNGTKTITNAGLFNASTSGVMLIKGDFSGIPVLVNDSIEFIFKLQVT